MSRKQEIIEVCVEMIDKDGFQNLSVKTIADRLGIKPHLCISIFKAVWMR